MRYLINIALFWVATLAYANEEEIIKTPVNLPERPGDQRSRSQEKETNVNRIYNPESIGIPDYNANRESLPVPDRWRLLNNLGLIKERWYDPYHQNKLKGDKPLHGEWFLNLGVISDTVYEPRRLPTAVGPQSTLNSSSLNVFGNADQSLLNENLIVSLVYYKGDTVFRPPDYEFRFTPVFNYNKTNAEEIRALYVDASRGNSRRDYHMGIQELFADLHLRNVSARYDFDSIRVGIQPFSNDFRGFLFQDLPVGIRLFGTRDNNIWQYNIAYFQRFEKDTNSGLNDIAARLRDDVILVFNLYRQDYPWSGFTSQFSIVHNRNRENKNLFYDQNGFLVRPASIGSERLHQYDVSYFGYAGDGHIGRLNLSTSLYLALGEEQAPPYRQQAADIQAFFAAAELSVDADWKRWRLSLLYGSGDKDPFDDISGGFDAIVENPLFAGSDASFWIRQGVSNIGGGGVSLSSRNGILNSLRSSKEHGQSNFTNPGIILLGLGADFDLTPESRLSINVNQLWFAETAVLELARSQADIDTAIGFDTSLSYVHRPFFSQNIILRLSAAVLLPADGYASLFGNNTQYSVLANMVFAY